MSYCTPHTKIAAADDDLPSAAPDEDLHVPLLRSFALLKIKSPHIIDLPEKRFGADDMIERPIVNRLCSIEPQLFVYTIYLLLTGCVRLVGVNETLEHLVHLAITLPYINYTTLTGRLYR